MAVRPGSMQRIHSRPLWPFCCFQTQTCFRKQVLLTTYSDSTLLNSSFSVKEKQLMNTPDVTFVKSTKSSATTEQTWHHWSYSWGPLNGMLSYGCHTELNLLLCTRVGDCLTSGQIYKSLMRFIDPNWDTNIIHKSSVRVNEIHSPVLCRFESTTGLGHIYKYSTTLPIPLNPKPSDQSCPSEVHFFSYPEKCCFIQTNQARLGLVALDLNNCYVW